MPVRVPSKIVQLNDAIKFPVVGSFDIEVEDLNNLFGTQSGLGSGIGYRGYKNLDEVLAQLYYSGVSMGGGGLGSGIEVISNGSSIGSFSKVNFSGLDIAAKEVGDTAVVIVDPSIRVEKDGFYIDRAKSLNFSGAAFQSVSIVDGIATIIVATSGVSAGISGMNVQDEAVAIGQFDTINFSGVNVAARVDSGKVSVLVRDSFEDGGAAFAWHVS